jgi:TetR/AcrR family transcriptional regulator, transcriptional repressor for nem operon
VRKHGETPLRSIAEVFLSERHVDNAGSGCALCALAGEARHASPEVRELLTGYVRKLEARIARAASNDGEKSGLGIIATIVGAVTLARAVNDDALAKSILADSLALILTQDGVVQ